MTEFKTILVDPPWPESGGGKIKRGADRHYPLIKKKEEIRDVIFGSGLFLPAADAHIYLWVTNNYLPWGLWLIPELGFRYVTLVTWAKPRMGIGQYFRGRTEHILFGVRGDGLGIAKAHRGSKYFTTLVEADHERKNGKRVHSAKPEVFYEMIEAASPGPRLELFARQTRPGWTAWGNEVP